MKKLLNLTAVAVALLLIASCTTENQKPKYRDAVDKVFAMFSSGETAGAEAFVDANYIEHSPPPGMDIKGLEGFKSIIKMNHTAFPDLKVTVTDYVENGDVAMVHYNFKGNNTGDMGPGMPATNKQADCNGVDVLKFKDGKCTEHWGYFEEMKMMTQLGLMPEPGAPPAAAPAEKPATEPKSK